MYKKISCTLEISYILTMLVILLFIFMEIKIEVVYNHTIASKLWLKALKNILSGRVKCLLFCIQQSLKHNSHPYEDHNTTPAPLPVPPHSSLWLSLFP